MIRVRGWSSIGPAQVIAQQEFPFDKAARRQPEEIARITIPDKDLAAVVTVLLGRCYQQNLVSSELSAAVRGASEVMDDKRWQNVADPL